jgi:xylulokinase
MITWDRRSCVIGCDVGTQSSKAVLVSDTGEVLATVSAPHTVQFPAPGWAQQDVAGWHSAVATVLHSLAAQAPGPVTHVGISAQVDGVVAVDERLEPLHPAIIWLDRRATVAADRAEQRIGAEKIYSLTGLNCDAGHSAPKMRWLLDNLPTYPHRLLAPASMVTAWLTGEVAQDHANASSSMLYDPSTRAWSAELLDAFDIDPDLLAPVVEATTDLGPILPARAAELGLDPGCRVIVGTGDEHAGAVGAGAVTAGVVVDITGTAEPIGTTAATPAFDPDRLVEPHAHAVGGAYLVENPGFVSGGSVLWLARLLATTQAEVIARADDAPPGAGGVTFVPALSGSMTPRWNAHTRDAFTGLAMEHGAAQLGRAVLEGCAYAARDIVDRLAALGLPADEVRVTGGGGRSATWMQIKADVIGRPVRAVLGETSAVGAAYLAAVAAGWHPDVPTAARALVRPEPRWFEPTPSSVEIYELGYRRYRAAFDAVEPLGGPA